MELTERRIKEGEYFINSESTLKEVASEFGVSLGTVAYDFKKLKEIDKELYEAVKNQVNKNKKERSKKGGLKTKELWIEKGVVKQKK